MQALLTHLIKMESKEQAEEAHIQFKSQVFAANPDLYRQLFAEEEAVEDDDIEWVIPESEEDFMRMMNEESD